MKINHPNEIMPTVGPGSAKDKAKPLDSDNDFASVFKEAAEKLPTNVLPVNAPGRTVQATITGLGQELAAGPEIHAFRLLDTLETYQRVLADPSANLRQVQPMVDQMKAAAGETVLLAEKMPKGHAVRGVIEETLIQINKEIIRFERGEYVDG